ncbi:mechanosensitive ion channel family protein [Acuticoccus sp.]|uniref:mechanosensitive ion channel family protein n=1 Tax=Acuticoccus sp. TaxID=1904378 RepID=UPI003B52A146
MRMLISLFLGLALACPALAQSSGSQGPQAFQIDTLNEGLGDPPSRLDRSTPQATLEAFVTLTGRADYDAAAHLLDLDAVPAPQQASAGPRLAEKLSFVLDRKLPIDFSAIPDRPDGMDTSGSEREPMVGVAQKSVSLGLLELPEWPVTVRLNRVKLGEEDPVWVFSRQTVEHVDELYALYGPTRYEQALPAALRSEAFAGVLWWEMIAFPLIVLFAIAAATLAWRLMTFVACALPTEAVAEGLRRGRLPVALLLVGLVMQLVVDALFEFSSGTDATLSTIFWITIVLALVFGASRVLDTVIDFTSDRYLSRIDDPENNSARRWYTNLSAAKRLGVIIVIVVGVAVALSSLRVFSSFGLSLLVSAGVATAIFGLAAQTVLGNIFASLQLAFAKPIRIGDAVFYDDHWAYVEQINYTYVQLRTWDLKRFIVPVKHFVSNPFENWTKEEPKMYKPVVLKLDHRADVELLRRTFADIVKDDPDWSEGEEPKVLVIAHDEKGMVVRFYCIADDPTSAWNLHCRVREKLLARLREEDEPSAFPRTRLAYVANTTGGDAAAPRAYASGARDTGEPDADTVGGGDGTTCGDRDAA